MAKTRRDEYESPLGWVVLGFLAGACASAALLLWLGAWRVPTPVPETPIPDAVPLPPEPAPPAVLAPPEARRPPPRPPQAAPPQAPPPPAVRPPAPPPAAAGPGEGQIDSDAAAAGMTSRAEPPPF